MKDIAITDMRNFVLLGHTGSGKTTLGDALLFKLGLNDRLGSVAAGTSAIDFTEEEISRKISIYSKPFCGIISPWVRYQSPPQPKFSKSKAKLLLALAKACSTV